LFKIFFVVVDVDVVVVVVLVLVLVLVVLSSFEIASFPALPCTHCQAATPRVKHTPRATQALTVHFNTSKERKDYMSFLESVKSRYGLSNDGDALLVLESAIDWLAPDRTQSVCLIRKIFCCEVGPRDWSSCFFFFFFFFFLLSFVLFVCVLSFFFSVCIYFIFLE
jgi:hypothetical protein